MSKYYYVLYLLTGVFATSPVISIPFGGRYVSLFTFFLIIMLFDLIRNKMRKLPQSRIVKYFLLWSFWGVLSSCFGLLYFADNTEFQEAAVSYIPKILIYVVILVLFLNQRDANKICCFGKGILFGAIINMIAAFADSAIFYSTGQSFINNLFAGYLESNEGVYMGLSAGDYFRSSGFNTDQACIGIYSAFITAYGIYARKYFFIIFAILGNLGAVSVLGVVSVFFIVLLHTITQVKTLFRFLVLGIVLLIFLISSENEYISLMRGGVRARIEMKQNTANDKDNARAMYWKEFFPAVASSPHSLFIGTGYYTASYAYHLVGVKRAVRPYDPEQTYFAFLFDVGLVGLVFMLLAYIKMFKYLRGLLRKKHISDIYSYIAYTEGALISFFGYHYTLGATEMMMLIGGIVLTVIYQDKRVVLEKLTTQRNIVNSLSLTK